MTIQEVTRYATAAASGVNSTLASKLYRALPPEFSASASASAAIITQVVPWTTATDRWGIAYPAGLVGVCARINGLPGSLPYEDEINNTLRDNAVAVPGVLPVGYTARWETDAWAYLGVTPNFFAGIGNVVDGSNTPGGGTYASGGRGLYDGGSMFTEKRILTADGWTTTTWFPTSTTPLPSGGGLLTVYTTAATPVPHGIILAPSSGTLFPRQFVPAYRSRSPFVGVAPPSTAWYWVGWRECGLQIRITSLLGAPNTGSISLRISHNADGSVTLTGSGAGAADGDTIDATVTWTSADFTMLTATTFESTLKLTGPMLAPLGIPAFFIHRFSANSLSVTPPGVGATAHQLRVESSPRVDIPLTFTATGDGGLIAPGGTVT